jgi:hypothetical protein
LVLAAVLAASALGAYFLAPSLRQRTAIEAIPRGAFLVVTIDLVKLRASPLAHELGGVREVSDVTELCGFDPLARAKTIAIGVPEKPDGVFGLSITHDLERDELAKCAERVMSARSAVPSVTLRGSWTVVQQEGVLSEATRAKIAYRDGAPLLVARGDYLAAMQQTLDGPRAGPTDHDALRKIALAHGDDALLVATAILPKSVRDKLKDELSSEADTSESKKTTMNAVLAVDSFALSVASRGDSLDVFVELGCDDAGTCRTVSDFLDRKRKTIDADPAARIAGVSGILDAIHLEPRGNRLDATLSAPASELVRVVRTVLASGFSSPR